MTSSTTQRETYSIKIWLLMTGAWLGLGLSDAAQVVVQMRAQGMQHNWWVLFAVTAAAWLVWIPATPAALAMWRRYPLPSWKLRRWLIHGTLCISIGAIWAAWSAYLIHTTNPYAYANGSGAFTTLWREKFFGSLVGDLVLYGTIVAFSIALEASANLARQEAASAKLSELLVQTQLAALRLQIEPHFIFNSLNAVTGLIREERGGDAIAMIASLGDLLRRVTDRSDRQLVTLEEEGAFLRQYLEIQQMRFAERLRYSITIPDNLANTLVPDFILQTLVENAIKHGIAKRSKGGEISIVAACDGTKLKLTVYNEGPPLRDDARDGVGIANLRQRLNTLFSGDTTLTLQNQNAGVVVTISLPFRAYSES